MKNLLAAFALALLGFSPETSLAQKLNVWKGGQAGRATDWKCPRNWSLGKVPDWTCAVVIEPDMAGGRNYPVIQGPVEPVQYLLLLPGARLEIAQMEYLEFELPEVCLIAGELVQKSRLQADNKVVAFKR